MIKITAAVVTLGCRLNQADSALLSDRLIKAGFSIVEEDGEDSPNLIVVNSCSVTASAARKTRQALASLRRKHPYAYIVLTGCAAEADPEEAADSSDYDILMTNADKCNLETILERRFNITPKKGIHNLLSKDKKIFTEGALSVFPFKTRANLKIQEGCENFCTYCIVPHVRGPERSRSKEETMEDFRNLLAQGFKEIVITGVNVCNYRLLFTGWNFSSSYFTTFASFIPMTAFNIVTILLGVLLFNVIDYLPRLRFNEKTSGYILRKGVYVVGICLVVFCFIYLQNIDVKTSFIYFQF